MSKNTVWVRFFPSDWLAGTRGMTAAETGIYITLIAMMYERGGSLPYDPARLARLCGASNSTFKGAIDALLTDEKFALEGDLLTNKRVVEELSYSSNRSGVGKSNAESRWSKNTIENKGSSDATAMQRQCNGNAIPDPYPDIGKIDKSISPIDARESEEKPVSKKPTFTPPDWVDGDAWTAFMEVRKKAKAVNSDYALRCIIADLERFRQRGHDPTELIKTAVKNGWKSVYEPKDTGKPHGKPKHTGLSSADYAGSAKNSGFDVV